MAKGFYLKENSGRLNLLNGKRNWRELQFCRKTYKIVPKITSGYLSSVFSFMFFLNSCARLLNKESRDIVWEAGSRERRRTEQGFDVI